MSDWSIYEVPTGGRSLVTQTQMIDWYTVISLNVRTQRILSVVQAIEQSATQVDIAWKPGGRFPIAKLARNLSSLKLMSKLRESCTGHINST